ncbi:MAG: site-specific recombinase, invertase Pin, partial [Naasia sp.]|uniref:recombinase family protein n=1 Tax=Naasia sp. TaxID=2546198 RepID=UPI002612F211
MTNGVGIYARQSVVEDQGIKQQIAACESFIARQDGWPPARTYVDNNVSGSKERGEKTEWGRMLRDIKAGVIDTVVVDAADRLSRRVLAVAQLLDHPEVRVVVVRQGIDTAMPGVRATLYAMVAWAESEVEVKEARNRPYRISNRARGHPSPGRVPFGYRWLTERERDEQTGVRYETVADEAAVVKRMFTKAIGGQSIRQICRDLNAEGHGTRGGLPWRPTTVRRMLLNPYYAALLPP